MARPLKYGVVKEERKLRMTDEGWEGVRKIAGGHNCPGIADLLERIGRGDLLVVSPHPEKEASCSEQVEAAIAAVLPTIPIKDRVLASKAFKKLMAQLQG